LVIWQNRWSTVVRHSCDIQIWWPSGWKFRIWAAPLCDISTSGSSYLDVRLTTMHHLCNVLCAKYPVKLACAICRKLWLLPEVLQHLPVWLRLFSAHFVNLSSTFVVRLMCITSCNVVYYLQLATLVLHLSEWAYAGRYFSADNFNVIGVFLFAFNCIYVFFRYCSLVTYWQQQLWQ